MKHRLCIVSVVAFAATVPLAPGADLIRLGVLNPQQLIFEVAGPDTESAVIEVSSNLTTWLPFSQVALYGPNDPVFIYGPYLPGNSVFLRARRYEPPVDSPDHETSPSGSGCPTNGPPDLPAIRDAAIPTATGPGKMVRLMIHVLANTDGSAPATSPEVVDQQVATLNTLFLPHRLQFVYQWRIISNSSLRFLTSSAQFPTLRQACSLAPSSQHNMFVTGLPTDVMGQSTYPWDPKALTTDGGTIISERRFGGGEIVLVHELGHALGLWHTHHGLEVQPQCTACWERADGLNGDTTGDRCLDTPAGELDSNGQPLVALDPCSNRLWPTSGLNNFMSLYPQIQGRFTPQQAGRMHAWLAYALTGWLDTNTPATPSDLAARANQFDEVFLSWTDNAWNDTGLVIERATNGGLFQVIARLPAGSNSFMDAPAPPAASLVYRVRATNAVATSYASAPARVISSAAPLMIWADAAYTGSAPDGTPQNPWPTFGQAYGAASAPAIIHLQSGQYQAGFQVDKPLRLEPVGGAVLLQKP